VKAVEQLEKSARQRNHAAMIEYARCLYDSVGAESSYTNRLRGAELQAALEKISRERAERDHKAVAWWYHCAENLKDPVAMQYLAKCFMEGRGVDKNEMAAVSWYTRGAELGHIPSMLSLAQCYDEGRGGLEKSHYNANWWRTRADAERGVRNAKIWLKSHKLR
jgi:TPR repeat protein